eukprot:411482-Pleurochrysis_carterae.AAC.1
MDCFHTLDLVPSSLPLSEAYLQHELDPYFREALRSDAPSRSFVPFASLRQHTADSVTADLLSGAAVSRHRPLPLHSSEADSGEPPCLHATNGHVHRPARALVPTMHACT